MKVNRRLCRAYVLKEDFEAFYASGSAEEAAQFLKGWTSPDYSRKSLLKAI
jgi:hypothetical protein